MPIESRMVKKTLDSLFGKEVEIKESQPIKKLENAIIGTYSDGDGNLTAAVVMDLPCACYSGAALSMIPADVAEENITSGKIDSSLSENVHEVLNVGVSFFSDGTTPDMRLAQMHIGPNSLTDKEKNVFKKAYTKLHVELNIPGYGSGASSMYLA